MELDSNHSGSNNGAGNGAIRREAITFSATGSEYFRIWIVNLLLSIVTLGIYSAWAKVRRNRYFTPAPTWLAAASNTTAMR